MTDEIRAPAPGEVPAQLADGPYTEVGVVLEQGTLPERADLVDHPSHGQVLGSASLFGRVSVDEEEVVHTVGGGGQEVAAEAEERAFQVVKAKQLERPEEDRVPEHLWPEIARVVGLGAVKYADLLPNRQSDYVFSWDKMLALSGNTAPYLQYAYARIRSIFRKAEGTSNIQHPTSSIQLAAPEELALARHLLNFGLVLEAVAEEYRPNFICNYLYDLAGHFTRFYENCPVLKAEAPERASRLLLCDLTARVLKQGLDVLGIEVLEQM